mmetsp:Transcript_30381/g.85842  ORF Transcript_30381/g.85842 Transcript_30381/m.85842 type:complete len:120 (+) Transcript_30381:1118-1477(+)
MGEGVQAWIKAVTEAMHALAASQCQSASMELPSGDGRSSPPASPSVAETLDMKVLLPFITADSDTEMLRDTPSEGLADDVDEDSTSLPPPPLALPVLPPADAASPMPSLLMELLVAGAW